SFSQRGVVPLHTPGLLDVHCSQVPWLIVRSHTGKSAMQLLLLLHPPPFEASPGHPMTPALAGSSQNALFSVLQPPSATSGTITSSKRIMGPSSGYRNDCAMIDATVRTGPAIRCRRCHR